MIASLSIGPTHRTSLPRRDDGLVIVGEDVWERPSCGKPESSEKGGFFCEHLKRQVAVISGSPPNPVSAAISAMSTRYGYIRASIRWKEQASRSTGSCSWIQWKV